MAGRIEARLAEMGIQLPEPTVPLAQYVPFVQSGNLLFVSGQLPAGPDGLVTGQLSAADHAEDGVSVPGSKPFHRLPLFATSRFPASIPFRHTA